MSEPIGHRPARRHPYQVLVAVACCLSGAGILLGGPPPSSVASLVPAALVYLWAVSMVVAGILVLAAAVIRSAVTALYLEIAGELPLSLSALTFGIAAIVFAGSKGFSGSAILIGFGIAAGVRWFQVSRTLRQTREAMRDG